MLDIKFIRENPDKVRAAAKNKNLNPDVVDNLLEIDQRRRELIIKTEDLRARRNSLNDKLKSARTDELLKEAGVLKQESQDIEPQLAKTEEAFSSLMLQIPNVPLDEVPIGKDDTGNTVVRTVGEIKKFDFEVKDHIALATGLDGLDLERGSKVAGFRGYFLKNDLVLLQFGLMQYTLQKFISKGFTPIVPPIIVKRRAFTNTGHFPWGEGETYKIVQPEDATEELFLAGTAEVPLVSYYQDEVLNESDLPIKMIGFSPCYRQEAGSYGKDTKGVYRVHEFVKTEQVVLCKADLAESIRLHEEMISYTEEIASELGLPYRILLMCTGDMGEPHAKKYDLEAWMPGKNSWGELGSDSIMTDFQSRRANIRYRDSKGEIKYVHLLNNTASNSPRWLVAILENFQQADGSIKVPPVLVPYVGKEILSPKG